MLAFGVSLWLLGEGGFGGGGWKLGRAMRNFFRTQKSRVHPRIVCIF